jgi:hypothetical protein
MELVAAADDSACVGGQGRFGGRVRARSWSRAHGKTELSAVGTAPRTPVHS